MKTRYRILGIGMLSLALSASAWGHGQPGHAGYGYDGWYGNAMIWTDSHGHVGYSGSLGYRVGGYAPGYVPWVGHQHGPRCGHGHPRAYGKGHHRGYNQGRKHGKKHHHRHH